MENLKEKEVFGKDVLETFIRRKSLGLCPFCGEVVDLEGFRDRRSLREYQISGLCQKCQDGFFEV